MLILCEFSDSLSFCIWTWKWCHDVTETLFFLIANFYLVMLYKAFTFVKNYTYNYRLSILSSSLNKFNKTIQITQCARTSSVALLLNLSVTFLVYCAALSNVSWLRIFSMMLSSTLIFSMNSRSICFLRAESSLSLSVTSWFGEEEEEEEEKEGNRL